MVQIATEPSGDECGDIPSQDGPLILEVKGNSLDDGPGIRTVVFFKGCPLSCIWCHNPESVRKGAEISFDAAECVGCGTCIELCDRGALDPSNPHYIDRERCDLCFKCVEECPSEALSRVGRNMEVSEIVDLVKKDIPFFRTSRGGVTLSGGEPTLFMEYNSKLLRELKSLDVDTLLETCGLFDLDRFYKMLYPYTDLIYFDIKILDSEEHRKHCGVPNQRILENFTALHSRFLEGGVEILPRVPLIPGITANGSNLRETADFLRENRVKKVALLSYNPLWIDKNRKIGKENPFKGDESKKSWMQAAEVERCRSFFEGMIVI